MTLGFIDVLIQERERGEKSLQCNGILKYSGQILTSDVQLHPRVGFELERV